MKNILHIIWTLIFSIMFSNFSTAQWTNMSASIDVLPRDMVSISVVDENIIWGLSMNPNFDPGGEVIRTTDGGVSWNVIGIMENPSFVPTHIFALNENTAWCILIPTIGFANGKIFKTDDGGATWVEQSTAFANPNEAAYFIHFYDENNGFAYGNNFEGFFPGPVIIYVTADGGNQWTKVENVPGREDEQVFVHSGNDAFAIVGDNIWFGTNRARIFKSTDRGLSWTVVDSGLDATRVIHSVAFRDEQNGLAVSAKRFAGGERPTKVIATHDGGATWTEMEAPENMIARLIEHIPGTDDTYIVYGGTFSQTFAPNYAITSDGAQTWITVAAPNTLSMQFISPSIGWAGRRVQNAEEGGMYKWTGGIIGGIAVSVNPVSCFGGMDGSINAEASFGTAPYTYQWNNNETTPSLSNLPVGTYSVTVTDASNLTSVQIVTISQPPELKLSFMTRIDSGSGNGGVELEVSGGTPPYSLSWSNGATTPIIANLAGGTYTVTVTENNGCVTELTIEVELFSSSYEVGNLQADVRLHPNPVHRGENAILALNSPKTQILQLSIFDTAGKKIVSQPIKAAEGQSTIGLSTPQSNGLYFVQLTDKDYGAKTIKLLVLSH